MTKQISRILLICTLLTIKLGIFLNCSPKVNPTLSVKQGVYDYAPAGDPTKKQNIVFVLIKPHFARSFKGSNILAFRNFAEKMEDDFEEILTTKGYSFKGPYTSLGQVVYADKKYGHFYLEAEIDIDLNFSSLQSKKVKTSSWVDGVVDKNNVKYGYQYSGLANLGGKIKLVLTETTQKERLLVKSIPLAPKSVLVKGIRYHRTNLRGELFYQSIAQDAGIMNPIITQLESYYKEVLQNVYDHLSVEEMKELMKQVEEIRRKR